MKNGLDDCQLVIDLIIFILTNKQTHELLIYINFFIQFKIIIKKLKIPRGQDYEKKTFSDNNSFHYGKQL